MYDFAHKVSISEHEMNYMQLYGKLANKAQSLDQMREMMYNLPKYIPITRMPPTSRAFYFHMLRVYLQVNTWMHLWQVLNPDDYGFMTNSKGNIVPRITDKGVPPAYLLKEIKMFLHKTKSRRTDVQ